MFYIDCFDCVVFVNVDGARYFVDNLVWMWVFIVKDCVDFDNFMLEIESFEIVGKVY